MYRPESVNSWVETDFDNFKFIVGELFLYAVAIYLKQERFEDVSYLVSQQYYVVDDADDPMKPFSIFRRYLGSLKHRNQRLNLRRLSVVADVLHQRAPGSGVSFDYLMQADLVLFLKSALDNPQNERKRWWPETLLYSTFGRIRPFEVFARAKSKTYLQKLSVVFSVPPDEVKNLLKTFRTGGLEIPHWEYHQLELSLLTNEANLGTT